MPAAHGPDQKGAKGVSRGCAPAAFSARGAPYRSSRSRNILADAHCGRLSSERTEPSDIAIQMGRPNYARYSIRFWVLSERFLTGLEPVFHCFFLFLFFFFLLFFLFFLLYFFFFFFIFFFSIPFLLFLFPFCSSDFQIPFCFLFFFFFVFSVCFLSLVSYFIFFFFSLFFQNIQILFAFP